MAAILTFWGYNEFKDLAKKTAEKEAGKVAEKVATKVAQIEAVKVAEREMKAILANIDGMIQRVGNTPPTVETRDTGNTTAAPQNE